MISLNRALLLLKGKKVKEAKSALLKLKSEFLSKSKTSSDMVLADAAVAYFEKNIENCEAILKNDKSSEAAAALGELYASLGETEKQAKFYSSLSAAMKSEPSILSSLCTQAVNANEPEKAVKALRDAMKSAESNPSKLRSVLGIAAKFSKQLKNPSFQVEI